MIEGGIGWRFATADLEWVFVACSGALVSTVGWGQDNKMAAASAEGNKSRTSLHQRD